MIGDITVADEIYIVCGYTDMRNSKGQTSHGPEKKGSVSLLREKV